MRHLPNTLSVFRLLLILPFLLFLYYQLYRYAFFLFLIAGITDGLDGWLARHFHWQSAFGSFIDPLSDKLLVASSFIALALLNELPWWLVILVFLRDFTISIGVVAWYFCIGPNIHFAPFFISKCNTALQLMLVTFCLFELAFFSFSPYLMNTLIILTALTTAITFLDYVWTFGRKAYSILHKSP